MGIKVKRGKPQMPGDGYKFAPCEKCGSFAWCEETQDDMTRKFACMDCGEYQEKDRVYVPEKKDTSDLFEIQPEAQNDKKDNSIKTEKIKIENITIDQELKNLIPPLSKEEFSLLEESIKSEGLREDLIVWQDRNIIIDGHNRYEICSKNNIPFGFKSKTFTDKEEVKEWIVLNQLGRRNLTDSSRTYFWGKLLESRKKRHGGDRKSEEVKSSPQNEALKKTSQVIAKEQNVSKATIERAAQFSKAVDTIAATCGEEVKKQILNEEIKATKEEVKALARKTPEEQKQIVEKITMGEAKNVNTAILAVNRDKPRNIPVMPLGVFNVIYADPPWKYEHCVDNKDSIEAHYPSMELEDIKKMDIPSADNSVLLLWATSPKLEEALQVLNAWGFNYRSSMVWDKENLGMGYWFRNLHEILLIGVKGKFSPPKEENRFPSVYREKKTQHSKKPEFIYEMIEKMFPGCKYLELFARSKRDSWEVFGNEV